MACDGTSRRRSKGWPTYDCATVCFVCCRFLSCLIDDDVEEDVESSQVTRHFTTSLNVDHQQLVHVLSEVHNGASQFVELPSIMASSRQRRGRGLAKSQTDYWDLI